MKKRDLNFWEKYSKRKDLSYNSLMNLEVDEELSKKKFILETEMFMNLVDINSDWKLVDLGGGIGLWSNFFADKVKSVTLVEKELSFIEIAKNIAKENISIIHSDVVDFNQNDNVYDVVFISGVTIYLNDKSLNRLMIKIKKYLKPNGLFLHRDAYGVDEDFILKNKFSDNLKMDYSAIYRSRINYDKIFVDKFNFKKDYDNDFYPKQSIHNNRSETRLRFAIYRNNK